MKNRIKPLSIRPKLPWLALWLALSLFHVTVFAGAHTGPTLGKQLIVIHAGRVLPVPGEAVLSQQTLVVKAGKLLRIEPGFSDPKRIGTELKSPVEYIDLSGAFVLPGLMDAHVHIMAQPSWMPTSTLWRSPVPLLAMHNAAADL